MSSTHYHIPVLLQECMEGLNINPEGVYVDATFGGGGHARKLFDSLNEKGILLGFDQDDVVAKTINWSMYQHLSVNATRDKL